MAANIFKAMGCADTAVVSQNSLPPETASTAPLSGTVVPLYSRTLVNRPTRLACKLSPPSSAALFKTCIIAQSNVVSRLIAARFWLWTCKEIFVLHFQPDSASNFSSFSRSRPKPRLTNLVLAVGRLVGAGPAAEMSGGNDVCKAVVVFARRQCRLEVYRTRDAWAATAVTCRDAVAERMRLSSRSWKAGESWTP